MLAICLGDPLSVNVEVLDACLDQIQTERYPVVMIGSFWHWRDQIDQLSRFPRDFRLIQAFEQARPGALSFLDIGDHFAKETAKNLSPEQRGQIAVAALGQLSQLKSDAPLAVVTMPIDKYAASLAGFGYPGQTEYFEALWRTQGVMILAGPKLRVALVTNHLQLSNVAMAITRDQIVRKLAQLTRSLRDLLGIQKPKIVVCGINPHCGENGLLGDEEIETVGPAVKDFNEVIQAKIATGPLPADTAFFKAYSGQFDAVLAMYHDQGLGPLKTVHFYDAINITGGLPHLRVSPDHGTASEIYLKSKASLASTSNCLSFAQDYLDKKFQSLA